MKLKGLASLAFVLLTYYCFDAATIWRLECESQTSVECKQQFSDLYKKILRIELMHWLQGVSYILMETIRENENTYTPEQQEKAEEFIGELKGFKQKLFENRNDFEAFLNSISKMSNFAEKYEVFQQDIKEAAHSPEGKALLTKTESQVVLNTLNLFEGLRNQDYAEFPEMLEYKSKFDILKAYNASCSSTFNDLRATFAQYLNISESEYEFPKLK